MENSGPVPDYSQEEFWAAAPYNHNTCDSLPSFLHNEHRSTDADVFFIHPTSYTSEIRNASWNADVTDPDINHRTDTRSLLYQASVFNGSCRIFAPRYRQAHLKAFMVKNSPEAKAALDLAYNDVKRAFQYYWEHENHGRPIIIASHSQGSHHAVRLLQEFFDGTPLQQRLVCAYIIGWQFDAKLFRHIPVGISADQTGCVVGWCTYLDREEPHYFKLEEGESACVNPLTWSTSLEDASAEKHCGALFRDFNKLYPHLLSARIDPKDHVLWVAVPEQLNNKLHHMKNLHMLDYNLFWMDIRENVRLRVNTFLRENNVVR